MNTLEQVDRDFYADLHEADALIGKQAALELIARHRIATAQASAAEIERLKEERDEAATWKTAVIDALVCAHIYRVAHDDDPRGALNELIVWEQSIALDPRVSTEARAMQDRALAAEAESARLREALEPFQVLAKSVLNDMRRKARHDGYPWVSRLDRTKITYGDLRRISALAAETSQEVGRG